MSHPLCLIAQDASGRFRAVVADTDSLSARLFHLDYPDCTVERVPTEEARRLVRDALSPAGPDAAATPATLTPGVRVRDRVTHPHAGRVTNVILTGLAVPRDVRVLHQPDEGFVQGAYLKDVTLAEALPADVSSLPAQPCLFEGVT